MEQEQKTNKAKNPFAVEMGKLAGQAVFNKYGKEHYIKMANKRWANRKDEQSKNSSDSE